MRLLPYAPVQGPSLTPLWGQAYAIIVVGSVQLQDVLDVVVHDVVTSMSSLPSSDFLLPASYFLGWRFACTLHLASSNFMDGHFLWPSPGKGDSPDLVVRPI